MISVKRFVIERAVDFITILEEDFPRQCFHELFPRFSMTSLIGYRNFSVLCTSQHVMYTLFLSMFIKLNMDSLCETVSSFS